MIKNIFPFFIIIALFFALALLFVTDSDLAVADVDEDYRVATDVTVEDGLGEEVYEFLLHEALDRAGSVLRLITLSAHVILKVFSKLDRDSVFSKFILKVTDLHLQDLTDV